MFNNLPHWAVGKKPLSLSIGFVRSLAYSYVAAWSEKRGLEAVPLEEPDEGAEASLLAAAAAETRALFGATNTRWERDLRLNVYKLGFEFVDVKVVGVVYV